MSKTIMILGASILQLPAILQAKRMNLNVVVVDMNPDAVGFNVDGITKEIISTIDSNSVLEAAKRNRIDGIMTLASDMPMRTVAIVSTEMGLNGINEKTAFKATNKFAMRTALSENGVPIPKFYKVSNENDFLAAIKQFDDYFIIKPVDNSGSRGIVKASNDNSIDDLLSYYEYSRKSSRNGDVLVEECMIGPEVSVETLTIDGKCNVIQITDKLTTGAPHFVEMGHSQPSQLSEMTQKRIKEITIAANKAIGINEGPSHTEIIVTKDGPKIVELGARLGGDCITSHLVPISTGVNMIECCINIALGVKPDFSNKCNKGAAIRYFHQKKGIINSISGIHEAEKLSGIKQISFVRNVGDEVTDVVDSSSRIGFVIAEGYNAKDAICRCENALNRVSIEIGEING